MRQELESGAWLRTRLGMKGGQTEPGARTSLGLAAGRDRAGIQQNSNIDLEKSFFGKELRALLPSLLAAESTQSPGATGRAPEPAETAGMGESMNTWRWGIDK